MCTRTGVPFDESGQRRVARQLSATRGAVDGAYQPFGGGALGFFIQVNFIEAYPNEWVKPQCGAGLRSCRSASDRLDT
jgi:hypothetical protein